MATVTTQERTNILKLVAGMFNAAPGATYLNEFTDAFVALNKDLGALANALGQTGAFKSVYPSFLSAEEFANKFLDTLGLKANTEAQDWVKAKVTAGESYASVIFQALVAIDASTAAEFKAAKDQLTNKATVAEYYSVDQNKSATDLAALQAVVAKVTNDAATVEAAKAGAAATAGQSFSLTEKLGESLLGTAGNDTFKAVFATGVASDSTLNLGDSIDGGAGTDTLNLILTSAATGAIASGVTIKNVEVVNLDVTAATAAVDPSFLKSSAYEGVKELWQVNTGASVAAANDYNSVTVAADVAAGFRGNGKVGTDAAAAVVTVDAASAAQKSLSIALDGVGSGTTLTEGATAKIETINISGSVAKATATTAGLLGLNAGGDALTVNGAFTSDVNIGTAISGAKIKTIDLSKSTGGVELHAGTFTGTLETIKGGAGNDTLTVDLGVKLVSVDLGAGNDTLKFADGTSGDGKELSVTLGAGKDTIETSNTTVKNVIDTADLAKGLVTVADFKIGEDTINLKTQGAVLTAPQLDTAKNASSLKAAIDSVAAVIGVNKSAVFSYGSDAYVFINDSTAGFAAGDGLIKLVGVDAALLSTDQNGGLVL